NRCGRRCRSRRGRTSSGAPVRTAATCRCSSPGPRRRAPGAAPTRPPAQGRYPGPPDADARLVQAMYWAKTFADARGGSATVDALTAKAAQMGDYLRYAFFDKYFKQMGCTSPNAPAGPGYNAPHYPLSWYSAWGGAIDSSAGWPWRIGSSHNHFGYQNPM